MGLIVLFLLSGRLAIAASNTVQDSDAGHDTSAITPNDLKPDECAALNLTAKISGSGTFSGTAAAELITGSSGVDIIDGGGGDDCIVGGGENDDLNGGAGQVDTVRDEFSAVSYTNNDGTDNWSAAWAEIGESDGASSGDVLVEQPDFGKRYTLYADADTHLDEQNPNTNYGTEIDLEVEEKQTSTHRTILHFDLSSISTGTTINSATAYFWVLSKERNPVNVHRITDTWVESTATWVNTGADYDPSVEGSFTPSSTGVYVSVDVTTLVQNWINGTNANYGLMLRASVTNKQSIYSSREEAGTSQDPYLVVLTSPTAADQGLRIQNTNLGAKRQADLSVGTSATLSFRYRRHGLDDAADYVAIEVSSTGGAPWTELDRFTGAAEEDDWITTSYDISSYISTSTSVRFISSSSLGALERVFFDNVQIEFSSSSGNDVLLGGLGDDVLSGGDGTDDCYGGDGTDSADATCENQYGIP
jgi:hypothetical protein